MSLEIEARAITEQAKQTAAVAAYLERYGSISNHMAIYQGVPGYGTRLGAPIYDLRERNYEIKTERGERNTVYRLVAAPKPQQLRLV